MFLKKTDNRISLFSLSETLSKNVDKLKTKQITPYGFSMLTETRQNRKGGEIAIIATKECQKRHFKKLIQTF